MFKSTDPQSFLQAKALEYEDGTRLDIKEEIERWYAKGKSHSWQRVKAFIGPAGYGKSVIMAYLAVEGGLVTQRKRASMFSFLKMFLGKRRNSNNETSNFTVGAAHFFRHDDLNAASARDCFFSIANQLAVTVPDLKKELQKVEQSEIESIVDLKVLFRSLLCAPMMRVKPPNHPIVVLVDALDEANAEEKSELVEILTTMWERETPQWLGLVLSSREGDLVKNRIEAPHMLKPDSDENVEDLETFLRQQLEHYMEPDEEAVEEAVEMISKRCGGVFLYASFVIKDLQQKKAQSLTLRDIRELKDFPPGLEVVYREYFTRLLQGPLENNYDQYQTLLSSMVAARSPLHLDIVAALLGLESQHAIELFLMRVEQLLLVEEGSLGFVHKSMRDFLQNRRIAGKVGEGKGQNGGKHLSVSVGMGHEKLVDVLNSNPRSHFALEHLIYHLCQRKDWEGVKEYLLNFDWVHAAVSFPGVAKRLVADTDAVYNYESFSDINVTDVIRSIELGRREIERDPDSLAFQLLGRIADRSHPILESLHESEFSKCDMTKCMYVPTQATLEPARSPLRKLLEGIGSYLTPVAIRGDIVVTGSWNWDVRLWDRRSGECLHVLDCYSTVNAVALDVDTVVSGANDKTVRLWDRRSGECLHVLEGHLDQVCAVAIDGDTVVSGSRDQTLRLWDRRSGECLRVLIGHFQEIKSVAIDGDTVVSGSSRDKTMRLWDRWSGKCLQVCDSGGAVTIDGDTVASSSDGNTVWLWDRRSFKCLHVLEGHSKTVTAVAIAGDTVASASLDKTVRLWDRRSGECLHVYEGYSESAHAVAIDGDNVVSGYRNGAVRFWNRRSRNYVRVLKKKENADYVMQVAMAGDTVVSGSFQGAVHLFDRRSGECLHVLEGHSYSVRAVAIDGDTVASGSEDCTVRLWDRRSGKCLHVLEGERATVQAVAIAGDTVVSAALWPVRLWNRRSGKCLHVLEGHSGYLRAVAIDGDTVASGSEDRTVRLWDRRSGKCLHVLEGHLRTVRTVAIDGDTVASGSEDGTVRLWNRRSGKCLHVLEGHSHPIGAVAIGGDVVVSSSKDNIVRLWNRRSGECLQVMSFDVALEGVAVETTEGIPSIVVSDKYSNVPHTLAPLFTQG